MIHLKNNRGLSLIELMVSITIAVLIITAIVSLFSTSLSITSNGLIKNSLLHEGRWAVDVIAKELSGIDIKKITSPVAPTATQAAKSSTLSFTAFHSNNLITYSVPKDTGEIYRLNHPLTDGTRANVKVDGLLFTRNIDGASIDISLILSKRDRKNTEYTETITTTITPLNNGNDN